MESAQSAPGQLLRHELASVESKSPPSPTSAQGLALVWILTAVVSGIAVDRWSSALALDVRWRVPAWGTLAIAAIAVWWPLHRQGKHFTASLLVLPVAFGLGGAWHTWNWKAFDAAEIGRSAPAVSEPCSVEVIALAHVQRIAAPGTSPYRAIPSGEKSQLQVEVVRIRNGQRWQRASGKCQLIVEGHLLGLKPNDRLRVFCHWQAITPPSNPGEFDYQSFARARRELCTLRANSPDCVTVVERSFDWHPTRLLSQWNAQAQSRIWRDMDRRLAPIACAVLLGTDHALPRELKNHYLLTGATHVLVVSGLHAGILVGGVFFLLRMGLLPRRVSLAIAMMLIVAYALFTGANPPVVRAAVLAEIVCVGLWLGVPSVSINSLAAAALTVLLLNPAELFLTGTQLSFLCSATLMWIASVVPRHQSTTDPLETLLLESRSRLVRLVNRLLRWSRVLFITSLILWLVTVPLVSMQFNVISPISVPSSLLVIPAVTFALGWGVVYLLVGSLIPWLAPPLCWISEVCFHFLDGVVAWTSTLPFAHTWTPGPPAWWVAGYYFILALLLRTGGIRGGWQRLVQAMALWVLIGAAPTLVARNAPQPMEVAFLDVGHGASVVMTTPEGMTLIYDAGGMGSPQRATDAVSHYLWSRGVRKIDGLILSHADVDHYNGVPGLIERFPIGRVFVSPHMFPPGDDPADHSAPASLQRLLVEHNIPIEELVMGDRLALGESTTAEVLYPDFLGSLGSDNANSLVVAIEHQGVRVLLPGDLESPGLEAVLADTPYDCDVLLAPHHGSSRSDPPGFAAWSRPEHVVISGGAEFSAPQVAATYRLAGAQVHSTGERGAVIFRILKENISTKFAKGPPTPFVPKD